MQNLGGKQSVLYEIGKQRIAQAASFPGQYTIDETRFETNIPIDGILLASSKFGQRPLVAKNQPGDFDIDYYEYNKNLI